VALTPPAKWTIYAHPEDLGALNAPNSGEHGNQSGLILLGLFKLLVHILVALDIYATTDIG